jgi:hypothetical protein
MTAPLPTVQFTIGNGFEFSGLNALIRDFNLLGPGVLNVATTQMINRSPLTLHKRIDSIEHEREQSRITIQSNDNNDWIGIYYHRHGDQAVVRYLFENGIQYLVCASIGILGNPSNRHFEFTAQDKRFYPRPWKRCRELGIRTLLDVSLNMDRFINPRVAHYLQYHPRARSVEIPSAAPGFQEKREFRASDYLGDGKSCFDVIMEAIQFVITAAMYNGGAISSIAVDGQEVENQQGVRGIGLEVEFKGLDLQTPIVYYFKNNLVIGQCTRHLPSVKLELGGMFNPVPIPIPDEITLEFQIYLSEDIADQNRRNARFTYSQEFGMEAMNNLNVDGLRIGASPSEIVRIVDRARLETTSSQSGPKRRNPEVEADRIGNNLLSLFNQIGSYSGNGRTVDEKANALVSRRTAPAIRFSQMSSEERKDRSISYHPVSYLFESSPSSDTKESTETLNWDEESFNERRRIADNRWRERNQRLVESIRVAIARLPRVSSSSSSSRSIDPFPLF